MTNSINIKHLCAELSKIVEDAYGCTGLYRIVMKYVRYYSKLTYLKLHKDNSTVPFHFLKPVIKLEQKFNSKFLTSSGFNNSFFDNFSYKLLSLDIQQAFWLLEGAKRQIKDRITNSSHSVDIIAFINSHPIFSKIDEIIINSINKKLNRKLKLSHQQQYASVGHKNVTYHQTTIVSSNIIGKCINRRGGHINALKLYNEYHNSNLVLNLSNKNIPPNIINFLSLGPNFSVPSSKLDNSTTINLIADLESIVDSCDTPDNHKSALRNAFNNELSKYKYSKPIRSLNVVEKQILKDKADFDKWIKEYKDDLIITKTDKTKQTIILNKADYDDKLNDILNDKNSFKVVRKNPIDEINAKVKTLINKLLKDNWIDKKTFNYLCNNNPYCPRMYGLPKAHKVDTPLRPIVNSYDAPWYNLSKFLNPFLNILNNDNPYDIPNSLQLKNNISKIKLDSNDILVSFDVVSLFPNVPLELFYKIIDDKFNSHIADTSLIKNKKDFIDALKLCLNYGYFTANSKCHKQLYGVPMGGTLSVNVAGITLNYILDKALQKLTNKPKIIYKYIDDLFLIVKKDDLELTLNTFNSIHQRIKFTIDVEANNILNFLDISIIRKDSQLKFKWFKKDSASNRSLNYYSSHPYHIKINTAKNLLNRAISLSDPEYHLEIINLISDILKFNLYPWFIIKRITSNFYSPKEPHSVTPIENNLKKVLTSNMDHDSNSSSVPLPNNSIPKNKQRLITQFFKSNTVNPNMLSERSNNMKDQGLPGSVSKAIGSNTKNKYKSIPFVDKLSHNINNILKKYDCKDIKLVYRPIKKLQNLVFTNTKDKIEASFKKDLIYKINCKDCNSNYIGQTKQFLHKRIQQHKANCNSSLKSQNLKTMLSAHSFQNKHSFDFDNPEILHIERNIKKRECIEAIHIAKNLERAVNERKDAHNMQHYYANIIASL